MFELENRIENGTLYLDFIGKLDSGTAPAAQAEILALCEKGGFDSIECNASALKYISSAGLRVLLSAKKKVPDFRIVDVNSEVYEIFEMTGFSEIIDIEKAFRTLSVEGCKIIGAGAKGTVYRYNDDTIIKVYNNSDSLPVIKRERELARKAFILGIPTAISFDIVKVDGKYGSVFELLDARALSEEIAQNPDRTDDYAVLFADLLRQIHSITVRKEDMPDIKVRVGRWADSAAPYLSDIQNDKLRRLIAETPDTLNLLHCDYHTNNIMMQQGEPVLIDMDSLSRGHPIFELANIHITYVAFGSVDKTKVEKFLGMPYEQCVEFWSSFLPAYLGDKADRAEEIENKIELLSYMRLLRHVSRRGINSEIDRKTVALCIEKISGLLDCVESLDF